MSLRLKKLTASAIAGAMLLSAAASFAATGDGDASARFAANLRQPTEPSAESLPPVRDPQGMPLDPQAEQPIVLPLPRLQIDVRPSPGVMPEDVGEEYVARQGIVDGDVGPRWYLSPYYWEAPGLFHRPIYFEDPALERHGRSRCEPLQPALSAARAAGQFVILPVQMVVNRPLDCVYSLGYGKPRVAPIYPFPWCGRLYHDPYMNYGYSYPMSTTVEPSTSTPTPAPQAKTKPKPAASQVTLRRGPAPEGDLPGSPVRRSPGNVR
jgi:hypothetical protein